MLLISMTLRQILNPVGKKGMKKKSKYKEQLEKRILFFYLNLYKMLWYIAVWSQMSRRSLATNRTSTFFTEESRFLSTSLFDIAIS